MSEFKIGMTCRLVNDPATPSHLSHYDNTECSVIAVLDGVLYDDRMIPIYKGTHYLVELFDGSELLAAPHELRRKSPPASTADEREYAELMDRLMNRKEQTA